MTAGDAQAVDAGGQGPFDPEPFVPLDGDTLERIEAVGVEDHEVLDLARTALHHRQEAMDWQDEARRLRTALIAAARALEAKGMIHSADLAFAAVAAARQD